MKKLTLLLAATLIADYGLSASVWADTILEPRSLVVHFEDLNINDSLGAATLYRRIHGAAELVCNDMESSLARALSGRFKSCVHGAVSLAVARVNSPVVTEYAATKGIVPTDVPIKAKFARNN
jgi:UrcA family protein